jgi:hypothetical protein
MIARPQSVISKLYKRIGLKTEPAAISAAGLPEARERDFSLLKYQMIGHPYRADIFSLLEGRAEAFGYGADLSALPGSGLRYGAQILIHTWRPPRKTSKLHSNKVARAPASAVA